MPRLFRTEQYEVADSSNDSFRDRNGRAGRAPRVASVQADSERRPTLDGREPGHTSAGTRELKAERKRQEILRAGLKVFAAKGFSAATMDDIAVELGATKGLLYYHFTTKHELLHEILESNDLTAGLDGVLDGLDGLPLREALLELAARVTTLFESNHELTRFLHVHSLMSGTETSIIYREILGRIYLQVARLLEGFRDRDLLRPGVQPVSAAHVIVSVLLSDIAQRFVFGDEHDAGAGSGRVGPALDIVLDGMAPASMNP